MAIVGANLFQAILDPLLVVQENGIIVDCNAAAVRFMALSNPAQVIGRSLGDFSPWTQEKAAPASITALDSLQKTLATGSFRTEWVHHRPDGCALILDVAFSFLEGSAPPLLLVHWRDISERRQRDEQLRQLNAGLEQRVRERTAELEEANARLAKASEHKEEFLATISHELRTPLTGIMGLTETLEAEVYGPLTLRQRQVMRLIWQSGDQLRTMINGILDLSYLQAHDSTLRRANVLVDRLCRMSLRVLEPPNCTTTYLTSYSIDRPDLMIEADEQRIVQMLSHLLGNAAKFTAAGGRIDLEVQSDPAARTVTLSVSDTGIGIDAGDLPRLFQPFVQLDARLARSYAGAGIGLALARAIAELHGGSVGVESRPGVGSRFWVTLPLA